MISDGPSVTFCVPGKSADSPPIVSWHVAVVVPSSVQPTLADMPGRARLYATELGALMNLKGRGKPQSSSSSEEPKPSSDVGSSVGEEELSDMVRDAEGIVVAEKAKESVVAHWTM